jgi:hypothetical protein
VDHSKTFIINYFTIYMICSLNTITHFLHKRVLKAAATMLKCSNNLYCRSWVFMVAKA